MPILNLPLPTTAAVNFDLQNQIGGGGEAEVFTANDHQLNAQIVIKRIPVSRFTNINQYFSESQKLYLTKHHNVVEILYGCQDADYVYLAMPYYAAGSVKGIIDTRFLTSREIIRYSLQFLSGLNNVHSKRLIHFDIKCENVLISNQNHAMLSDFGLAEYTSHYGFSATTGTTPVYAPPEFFSQAQHNVLFDIYQAGLTMYRMAVGDTFMENQLLNYLDANANIDVRKLAVDAVKGVYPNRTFPLHIPRALSSIVKKAIDPDPNSRYSTVIDILNDLSAIGSAHDWKFTRDALGTEKWELNGHSIEARMGRNSSWDLHAQKNGRRVTAVCKKGLTNSEKKSLIYNKLMNGL